MSVIKTKVKVVFNTKDNTTVTQMPTLVKGTVTCNDVLAREALPKHHCKSQCIHNQKFPDKPDLIKDKFFDYDIYHTCIDGVEMYAVTELLRQYSLLHESKRIILNNYLRLDSTKQYIDILYDNYNKNNILHNSCNTKDKNKILEDVSDLKHLQRNENDLEFDRRGIILRFSFDGYDIVNVKETTLMCEKLLTHCLMWLDMKFANDVFDFIEKLRHQDNDFLKHNLEIVEIENNELKLMTQKQTQLISDIQSKNNELNSKNKELETIITKLNTKNEELTKINSEINYKNKYLNRINSSLEIKNKELENIISTLSVKSEELKTVNKDLENTIAMLKHEKTELEMVIADKNEVIEDLNQAKLEYENKCKELNNKLEELESLNTSINQAKLELERLNQELKIRVSTLEPRQVIDTRKTNWTLYFVKRNLFLKNNHSLYIHVSFGYRNQRDISKFIKDNIVCCVKNCPNGQVSRQGIVKQVYEQLKHRHAESCNCKENNFYKYLNTVEFRLDLFCTQ